VAVDGVEVPRARETVAALHVATRKAACVRAHGDA